MDLSYTPKQLAFRAEVREWLAANVPDQEFASYDTREGFEQHRAWEARLADAGWSSVTWPVELGGRGCDLTEWLIFEEEYWAADAPMRVQPERHPAARADDHGVRHARAEGALSASHGAL